MAEPIHNPEVPFVGRIADGFQEGKIIRIQGFTSPVAERFNINLKTGRGSNDDIAIHLSVRLAEGYIARNSFENGDWGDEQGDGELKIGTGQRFEILLLCAANDYKVAVNGQHFCEFPQRIPPSRISHLEVTGDLSLSLISFEGGDTQTRASQSQQFSGGYNPQGQYGPPQGQYGPPPGDYGGQHGYYGPPQGYGPAPGGYGPPQGGYGPPPPPGHQPQDSSSDFLSTAGSLIAGAISSGMADKLIGSLTGGGNQQQHGQQPNNMQHPQQPPPPPQQQPAFNLPQFGGQGSVGGLGSIGSLLTDFAGELLKPRKVPQGLIQPSAPPLPGFNLPSPNSMPYPSMPQMPLPQRNPYPSQPYPPNQYPSSQPYPNQYPSYPPQSPYQAMPPYQQPQMNPTSPYQTYPRSDFYGGGADLSYPKKDKMSKIKDAAMKYGIPIVGAGVATYAISQVAHGIGNLGHVGHYGRYGSSSSSCSDSD